MGRVLWRSPLGLDLLGECAFPLHSRLTLTFLTQYNATQTRGA